MCFIKKQVLRVMKQNIIGVLLLFLALYALCFVCERVIVFGRKRIPDCIF